jgi:hypothetical protein
MGARWWHVWSGTSRVGKHIRVVLRLPMAPEDPRVCLNEFPTRRDHIDGPRVQYRGSFDARPTPHDLDLIDPEGKKTP